MRHFPLFASLQGRPCLLVGGGAVAARKSRQLLAAGAQVTVVAPRLDAELAAAVTSHRIRHWPRQFTPELIGTHWLIVAATGNRAVNEQVAIAATEALRFCNVVDDPELSSFIMPAVVDRSPIVIAVSTGGAAPVLARLLRQRIEDWLPARIDRLARWAGRRRITVKHRITDQLARLRFWENVLDGAAADALLNNDIERANRALDAEIEAAGNGAPPGVAWLVGAGPGDPGLLTRRGAELLRRADVVLYDRLVSPAIIALARRDTELIAVGKSPGGPSTSQQEIDATLVRLVGAGRRVCRLKGGDPFIFGRGGEEIAALARAGLTWEVVPGITAAAGCAAAAGIPLTHRGVAGAVTLVTGHAAAGGPEDSADWAALGAGQQTLAIYMGVTRLEKICTRLVEFGRAPATPVAIVENGTTTAQRIIGGTLDTIVAHAANQQVTAPALLIVGDVVALADTLHWQTQHEKTTAPPTSGVRPQTGNARERIDDLTLGTSQG